MGVPQESLKVMASWELVSVSVTETECQLCPTNSIASPTAPAVNYHTGIES